MRGLSQDGEDKEKIRGIINHKNNDTLKNIRLNTCVPWCLRSIEKQSTSI